MHNVAILTYDNAAFFELGCAVELFALPRPEFEVWYGCEVVSFASGPFTSAAGMQLSSKRVTNLDAYSVLVVPSWPTAGGEIPHQIAKAIKDFYLQGMRIVSFCSGAFLLAQLGLLDGRKATTHWRYAELFKQRFPQVSYVDDVLYLYDGQLGCSAGSSAAIDLGIEVIRGDYGHQIANKVARRLVLSAHRKGGQSQFAETPVPKSSSQFTKALDWAVQNISGAIDIDSFAEKANMARRTFDRKFRADFNLSPKAWITLHRINFAKELLENHDYSIEKVAEYSGFENATTMRHHFRKELGISPNLHRKNFNSAIKISIG